MDNFTLLYYQIPILANKNIEFHEIQRNHQIGNVSFVILHNVPGVFSPGTYICALHTFFVQFIRLAEDQIADDEQDNQGANRQIFILEGDAEEVHFHARGDLADEGH